MRPCALPPRPGDRSPGFFIEPTRCWAFVYDHNLQSTHCRETPALPAGGTPFDAMGNGGACGVVRTTSKG
jgi:hypothetical protein